MGHGEVEDELVEIVGRDAGTNVGGQHVERLGREPPGLSHAGEGIGTVHLDLAGLTGRRLEFVDERHRGREPGTKVMKRSARCESFPQLGVAVVMSAAI